MRRLDPARPEALHDAAATRAIERALVAALPPHTLMARAGESVARLATALYPHARHIWVACGPGNNGGDGLIAAAHLVDWARERGARLTVTLDADATHLPPDANWALSQARARGLSLSASAPDDADLVIDAVLGLGARSNPAGALAARLQAIRRHPAPVLCVDLPSGLNPDSGHMEPPEDRGAARHTLSLLTLKPGLFTAHGRDAAGEVWFDDLGAGATDTCATAHRGGFAFLPDAKAEGDHAGHKGSYGDVGVLGGQLPGQDGIAMSGAALLAASAALHAGAGRVFVALVGSGPVPPWDTACPELMFRSPEALLATLDTAAPCLVVGCGGGTGVREWLPRCLGRAPRLVIDADGLNAVAQDAALQTQLQARASRGFTTVLTPHPLEAARLLGCTTAAVMADRLGHAQAMADRFHALVVLKGSGTVVAAPGHRPWINATGNARLATAGTGDVLAGLIGAALARPDRDAWDATRAAVAHHGALADHWPTGQPLTAGPLARAARPY